MNTHTDPGWWIVWMLYGVLLTIVAHAVLIHHRRRKAKKDEPKPCQHKRLRFHTELPHYKSADSARVAVCLDCGKTDVRVDLICVNEESRERVLSEVMQARGYDQDPAETTRWTRV